MPVRDPLELKRILFDAYDGFADKRYKNIERDAPFIVDDRSEGDLDARGQLFLWFCQLFVTVDDGQKITLALRGGVPVSAAVNEHLEAMGAVTQRFGIELAITPDNLAALEELADKVASITRRPYDVRAYKYVVPRVAASLRRLGEVLRRAWGA